MLDTPIIIIWAISQTMGVPLSFGLAIIALLGLIAMARAWKRWKGPRAAKVLIVVGLVVLLVPATCNIQVMNSPAINLR